MPAKPRRSISLASSNVACRRPGTATRERAGRDSLIWAKRLAPHKALELAAGPVDRLIGCFALLDVLHDHLGGGRLREYLVGDARRRGIAGHRLDDIAARRIVPDPAFGRPFRRPGIEIAQRAEGRDVVALAAGDELFDRIGFPQIE